MRRIPLLIFLRLTTIGLLMALAAPATPQPSHTALVITVYLTPT
jgi:hypothetical protein